MTCSYWNDLFFFFLWKICWTLVNVKKKNIWKTPHYLYTDSQSLWNKPRQADWYKQYSFINMYVINYIYIIECHSLFLFWHMWSTVIQKTMWQPFKKYPLFQWEKKIAYGFETQWDWVNDSRFFILGELFLQVPDFPDSVVLQAHKPKSKTIWLQPHFLLNKNPSWNKLQMYFLSVVVFSSLTSMSVRTDSWKHKTAVCISFASYSHNSSLVPEFSCLSHGNLSSHIKTKGIQRSASWLPHQNNI